MSEDFDWDRRQRQHRSDDRYYDALLNQNWGEALREISTDATLAYLHAQGAAGGYPDTDLTCEQLLADAELQKTFLLQKVAQAMAKTQAIQGLYDFLPFTSIDPSIETERARLCKQLGLLHCWIADTDPAAPEAENRLHLAADSWRSFSELHVGIQMLEMVIRLARICREQQNG